MPTKLYDWVIASHESPSGFTSPPVGVVRVQATGDELLVTTRIVEVISDDQRVFRTKSDSVYELVGPPLKGWTEYAGETGIDDFAPFDVSRFGVTFLDEPTRGRITRQGCDWLWSVSRDDDRWRGRCVEDRPMMCRVVSTAESFATIAEARDDAVAAMERVYKEAGGKRLVAAGGSGLRVYADEPN
jgi:hypothetical protein